MFFFFVFGEHTFRKAVPGYEKLVCQCYNCGNMSGRVLKSHPWFTICWIPLVPLSIKGYQDVACHICNFRQPLENRPDVKAMQGGQGPQAPNGPAAHPGWQQGPPPPGHGPPPPNGGAPARYG